MKVLVVSLVCQSGGQDQLQYLGRAHQFPKARHLSLDSSSPFGGNSIPSIRIHNRLEYYSYSSCLDSRNPLVF